MKKLNIWRDEGKVSASIIEKFAENLGVTFPKSYIYLISEHDYLYPEEDCFIFIDNNKNTDDRNILLILTNIIFINFYANLCLYSTSILCIRIVY